MAPDAPEVVDNPAASRLEARSGNQLAYAAYEIAPGTITFTHTLVPQDLRHHGIATALVEAGIALARSRALKIVPRCPFFKSYFAAHRELAGLLADPAAAPPAP
jgi:predicted GNAT family acetyltransferase